ncbi:MAG TPA: hypothetical protein ENK91_15745 [Bacteroidetes bacterium]|nr:hypothetical protein [Bacteroidota bacterium]
MVLLFVSFSYSSQAQKGYELGGWIGISNYFGELNSGFNLTNPGLAGGLAFRLLFNERISMRTSLSYGQIKGDDRDSYNTYEQQRNLSFVSPVFDFTHQFEFNFLPYIHGSSTDYFSPYVAAGIDIFYYNPRAQYDGKWYNLRELGTEGQALGEEYFEYGAGLVVAGGIKWDITHLLSVNVEASYRFTSTDYLDDVSTAYPNMQELRSLRGDVAVELSDRSGIPGFAVQGKQRGNSRDKDKFSFIGISLMYYFGSLECPPINKYSY